MFEGVNRRHRGESGSFGKPEPVVTGFFDERTFSVQYVVADPSTGCCAIVDPVLDYDEKSGNVATFSADRILQFVKENKLKVQWVLDTHPHADHFSAASYIATRTGAPTGIGAAITDVQKIWKTIYNLPVAFSTDGSQWDVLFADGATFSIGELKTRVMVSPGHTLASVTYVMENAALIHDTLFMPDSGTARTDFPGADAGQLWDSIQSILALPEDTRLFVGHDYMPNGRKAAWETSVAEQKARNIHLLAAPSRQAFIDLRNARDARLAMPRLILHALQVNIAGGKLPPPELDNRRYLKIPLNALQTGSWD